MHIAYIVHGERPENGIIKNQVLNLYNHFGKNLGNKVSIYFFCNLFIYLIKKKEYETIKKNYAYLNIKVFPTIIIPERFELKSLILSKISPFINSIGYFLISKKYDKIIGRSYISSFILTNLKFIFNNNTKFIFDPRSLYPIERYEYNYFKSNKLKCLWLEREKNILKKSDRVISVSNGMSRYFSNYIDSNKVFYLPFSYTSNRISVSRPIMSNKIIGLYIGSLSLEKHNNANNYLRYCLKIHNVLNNINFIFVVQNLNNTIKELFLNNKTLEKSVFFYTGNESVNYWLNNADFGMYFMKKSEDSFTRMGVKSIEYITNGLPIFHNEGVIGIKDHINNKYLYNLDRDIKLISNLDYKELKKSILSEYSQKFSIKKNANLLSNFLNA